MELSMYLFLDEAALLITIIIIIIIIIIKKQVELVKWKRVLVKIIKNNYLCIIVN